MSEQIGPRDPEQPFPKHHDAIPEFGPYRTLEPGEQVQSEHVVIHVREGILTPRIPTRIYGHRPNLSGNDIPPARGKA